MKKIVLIMFSLLLFQTGYAQKVRWGAKAGYNLSNLESENRDVDYLSGFHVGGTSEFRITPKIALEAELLYSQEGGKYSFEINDPSISLRATEKVKLGYLNFPIMAKYYLIDGFSVQAGPQIGYLLSGKSDYTSSVTFDGSTVDESGSRDIKDDLKSFSYGINFGFDYELKNHMFFQARYHLGLSDNVDMDNPSEGEDFEGLGPESLKNRGFQFSIGYRFY